MPIPATTRTSNSFVKIELKNLFIQLTFMLTLILDKHISGRPYRLDERRIFRVVAQFMSQTAHRDIHGAVERIAFYSSQFTENLVAVQYLSLICDQQRQCGKLIRSQID